MEISPGLEALRADPRLLTRQQAAVTDARDEWLAQVGQGALPNELERYDHGQPLHALPVMTSLMTNPARADSLVATLLESMLPALRQASFALVPFRHQSTDHHCVLELARSGSAALSLMAYRPRTARAAASASFASGERHELCLRGNATGRTVSLNSDGGKSVRLTCTTMRIERGWCAAFDNARQTKLIEQVAQPLVVLRLARDGTAPVLAREYRLADSALLHQSAADRRDSRREIALAVLGSMGRRDALPAMVEAARAGPAHVRWEALRQTLALDAAGGFAQLSAIAEKAGDELAVPAAALRAQLLQAYPMLATTHEAALCPA